MAMPNAVGESVLAGGGERKRKRSRRSEPPFVKRRTEGEQRIYSRLIEALRRVWHSSASAPSSSSSDNVRSCAVREAADRVLAVSARGRTRWSRAILSGRRTLKHRVRPKAGLPKPASAACIARAAAERRKTPALEKKTRVLGRLVPGCRKLHLPSLLEEASDYITALEMQVRAMSAIAEAFSATGSASWPPTHANPM